MEGIMQLKITIELDGRQVGVINETVAGDPESLEEQFRVQTQRAGRILLEHGLQSWEVDCPKPTCCGPVRSRGRKLITLMTTFGAITVSRRRYRCCRCGEEFYPADTLWRCGRHQLTRPLAKRVCQLATIEHFTRLPGIVADQHGVHLEHECILELVHDVGGVADAQRRMAAELNVRRDPGLGQQIVPEVQPQRVCVSCDGIMYCTNQTEPVPEKPGAKRLIWQQMKVGCVSWQDDDDNWHKQLVWGRESPEEFGAALFETACRCGYLQAPEKLFGADGGAWCWDIQARYFQDAQGILDWYHASEHIWEASRQIGREPDEIHQWRETASSELWTAGGQGLMTWLKQQIGARRGHAREALQNLHDYVEARSSQMDYSRYREQGWPIGTGIMESSCKQLVGMRLKGPGMHWTEQGALAVTALRAIELNEKWDKFWSELVLAT
jgi:hypothetical protein